MALPELFANVPSPGSGPPQAMTTLASGGGSAPASGTVETWGFASAPPTPLAQSGQYHFIIVSGNSAEICVDVTGGGGTSRQIVRGADGTTPIAHSAGDSIYPYTPTAEVMRQFAQDRTDKSVNGPWQGRGISVTNLFTDPRFTSAAHALAAAVGTYSEAATVVADGYQQLASPKSAIEVIGTPSGVGSYIGVGTKQGELTSPRAMPEAGKILAGRCAGRVVSVAGGGTWHVALALVYYTAGYAKVGEAIIWTSPTQSGADSTALATALGGSSGWFDAEGFDNQTPLLNSATTQYISLWAELELRVYLDSGTPGAIQLRMTEAVGVYDPDCDIPYYVGGDINAYTAAGSGPGYSSVLSAKWTGTADASTSVATFDPLTVYPSQEWGFNDYAPVLGEMPTGLAIKVMKELGCTISREVGIFLTGPTATPIPTSQVAWLKSLSDNGIKLILGVSPPSSILDTANYSWPTQAANQATMGTLVVNAISQLVAAGIPLNMIYGVQPINEPNNPTYGGSAGSLDPASYVAFNNAIYSALKGTGGYPTVKLHGGVISAGGTAGTNNDYGYWLTQMYAAGANYDVLDVHPYPIVAYLNSSTTGLYAATSAPPATGWTTAYGLIDGWDATLKKIKDTMNANSDSRSIFVSEIGQVVGSSERNQSIAYSLMIGRLRRDPKVVGVTPNGFIQAPSTPVNDWTPLDPSTLRRRASARTMARMRGMPPMPPDASVTDAHMATWKRLHGSYGVALAGGTAAFSNSRYDMNYPSMLAPGVQDVEGMFYLDPSQDLAIPGKALWVALEGHAFTNNVAPAVTFTWALYPVTAIGGASGSYPSVTLGAAAATLQMVNPPASTANRARCVPVQVSPGWYIMTLTTNAATAAGSNLLHGIELLYKYQ